MIYFLSFPSLVASAATSRQAVVERENRTASRASQFQGGPNVVLCSFLALVSTFSSASRFRSSSKYCPNALSMSCSASGGGRCGLAGVAISITLVY